ncbi:GGDEF domain-containing protein [Candidatus Pacearchaeota archaeon]|nr:GGDEF domain-containing protein [Candidatus Pacearchaeota archaeon]
MKKDTKKKLHALDPRFRKRFTELMSMMDESISLLYEAATHDEKTGLYNNKFFENMLEMEMEKAKRGKQKLSLVIIDIDFFKKINDTYGHMKADELLAQLAKVLMEQVRKSDIAARFGGEEFIILLPETNLEKAKRFTTRLRNAIKADNMLSKHGVEVSGGITEFKKSDTAKRLKERVDKALYQAKKQGRNRFETK